jgi:solute carrier family 66, member 2
MGIEATLGLPQVISNLKTKSVKGLSYTMIGMWFMGDFVKTVYFVTEVTIY